ncbi:ARMT1-like domain-containing protein [Sulfurovum sp.]|uniref:damage-control phosphatase ARMT1 family protein n=1 Tax=Sulfurovum sp. TaxID=1969726 RepID=UPI0025EA69FD|nr:ARMT1-like domain-containing protein [Sulfurovum sp.]
MNIKPDCITCIMNQTLKVCKLLEVDDLTAKKLLDSTAEILVQHDLSHTPPQIAKETYSKIAELTGVEDPVAKAKALATEMALEVDTAFVQTLHDAVKFAVIGNVIDFGAQKQLNLDATIQTHFHRHFGIDDFGMFEKELATAKTLVYIGDNTGEHIFDKLLIETIKKHYDIEVYYFVRGAPIINDVTCKEAEILRSCATVTDTGVPTPGYDLQYANASSKTLFDKADIVLAKGMGNFESLYDETDRTVYYLFIVKCNVVSQAIGQEVGELIFSRH